MPRPGLLRPTTLLVVLGAVLSCRASSPRVVHREGEPDVYWTDGDTAVANARAHAQATVDSLVWYMRGRATLQDVFVKARFRTSPENTEHIWVAVYQGDSVWVTGRVDNDPLDSSTIHYGDTVRVALRDITDWRYTDSLGLHGAYTTKALRAGLNE